MEEDSLSYRLHDDLETSCWEMCEEFGCIPYCPAQLPRHGAKAGGWLPTHDSWDTGGTDLPFGWEAATDKEGVTYYVNHMQKTSTYEDPRKFGLVEPEDLPDPREVNLERNAELGFGFVAGSEKPVIVRFVTGGGPSVDKLLPGDQILSINGEDVARAPRDHVIQLVRNCKDTVQLVVCQPPLDNDPSRKSALLSVSKKAKLKTNPSRVRFAESVDINGSLLCNPSTQGEITSKDSVIPLMPNVLKVFLENGQTKSFKYDSSTTVQDVLDSLQAKLGLISTNHFSLVVEHVKSPKKNKLTLLNPQDTLAKIASRPGAHNLRCLFRVTFVPKDAYDLLRKDSVAFEYLYVQCCNDVVQERFAPELKYETALRLAALHIHQHVVQTGLASNGKITVKMAEKECGLERFVPASLTDTMKRKELRKLLSHFLKINTGLASQGQKFLTGLQAKLHYLNTISDLPSYGAKCFSANLTDSDVETVILISPKFGMSQINSLRNSVPLNLCDIEGLGNITISKDDEISRKVDIQLKDPDTENITLFLEARDAEELVLVLQGYYKLLTERTLQVINLPSNFSDTDAPSYCGSRQTWNSSQTSEDNKKLARDPQKTPQPPYHDQTETFKMPNGQMAMGSDEGSDGGSSRDSTSTMEAQNLNTNIDRNRNITLENNANLNNSPSHALGYPQSVCRYDNTPNTSNTSNENNNSSFTGGILKKVRHLPNNIDEEQVKKEEDIRRVAEMEQILQDAEQYLTDADCEGENTDAESAVNEKSSRRGQFNHSDSFLMLLQEKEKTEDVSHTPPSLPGDSICRQTTGCPPRQASDLETKPPTTSRSQLKNSDSSFGLHSPDNLPMGFDPKNEDVQMLLKKYQENPNLPRNFPGGALVLDPDLIDLTMIPPPITPDEDGVYKLLAGQLSTVSTPPTPFADRQTLEAELRMLQKGDNGRSLDKEDIGRCGDKLCGEKGDVRKCGSLAFDEGRCSGDYSYLRSSFGVESQSDTEDSSFNSSTMPDLAIANVGAKHFKLEDIDSFIANMAVPPPPSGVKQVYRHHSPIVELTSEDISAFIIPPPPTTIKSISASPKKPKQSPAKKITFAKEAEVMDDQEAVRNVRQEQEQLSSKIAQDRLAFFHGSLPSRDLGLALNKDKFGYPTNSKLAGVEQSKNTEEGHQSQVQMNKEVFMGQLTPEISKTNTKCQNNEEIPPLPPPRSTIPKQNGFTQPSGLARHLTASTIHDAGPTLVKSISQDTIVSGKSQQQNLTTQTINGTLSSSSDDITNDITNNKLKKDPSMISMTSSSDSLSSISSVTTVKSVSPSDLPRPTPTESTNVAPPLLPRQSPSKAKPPLASPEDIPANLVSNSPFKSGQTFKKMPGSPKPDLPSRLKSQSAMSGPVPNSPKSNGRSQSMEGRLPPTASGRIVKLNGSLKKLAASPPGGPAVNYHNSTDVTGHHSSVKMINGTDGASPTSESVDLPHKAVNATERLTGGRKLPVPPPGKSTLGSPYRPNGSTENTVKQNYKNQQNGFVNNSHVTNGYNGHSSDYSDDEEDEGTSVDGPASLKPNDPQLVFSRAEKVVSGVVFNLNESKVFCTAGDKSVRNEEKFLKAKELLTNEARQFVTASKLFVKSATESEEQLLECLNHCVHMIGRIGTISRDVALYTTNPSQTQTLISKVSDVVETYLETLQAASQAIGRDMNDPSMNILMKKATLLAGVLTSLMRSLRVFN